MLRAIPKILAALVAIGLLLVGVLAVALPRLVNTEEFRRALHETAAEALGTPVEWERLEAGIVPLRLTLTRPTLVGAEGRAEEARFSADRLELRISALALLRRAVVVDSLVLSGVDLVVTRREGELVLPIADPELTADPNAKPDDPGAASGEAPSPDAPSPEDAATPLSLALRRFVIEDSRVVVRDRTLPTPLDWQLEGLDLVATGKSLDHPLVVSLETQVVANGAPAGGLRLDGEVTLGGLFDLDVGFERLLLETLQPYVSDATLAGALSGTVAIEGGADVLSRVESDLVVEGLAVRTYGLDLAGRLELDAQREGDAPARFDARLDLGAGGRARFVGTASNDGALEARADLEALDLAPYAALAGGALDVSGAATGRVDFAVAPGGKLERVASDLRVDDARYVDEALSIAGTLALTAEAAGLAETEPVRFELGLDLAEGGGRVEARGRATLAGAIDTRLAFDRVDLTPIAPLLPPDFALGGRLSGDADVALDAERNFERLNAKLVLADARVVSDPVDLAGRFDLDVKQAGAEPIALDAVVALGDGGRLAVKGTSTIEGRVDVALDLASFDLAIVRPFVPVEGLALAGRASGTGRVVGALARPEFVGLDVGVEAGVVSTPELSLEGPYLAVVKMKEPVDRPRGIVELDLTAAALRHLDRFSKRAGMRAEAKTRFVPKKDGVVVFESRLALRDADEILIQGTIAETTSVAVTTSRFDLTGWSEVFPVLEPYAANGLIAIEGLGVEWGEARPRRFGGRLELRGVGVTLPGAGSVRLRGAIVGEGERIATRDLRALVGGATIGLDASIEDPLDTGRFEVALRTREEVEVNRVLSELTTTRDTLYGPLALDGRVTGRLDDASGIAPTLAGRVRFTVGERGGGRLRGVSLLRTILDQIPLLGGAARLTRPFRGGRSVDDYFTERFELIEGVFEVGDGRVRADPLRLVYPGYEARLVGPMRIADLGLEMSGELLLKSDLVSTLGGLAGGDVPNREPIRIPLARVTSTLDAPKVVMTPETLAAVPKLLFQGIGLDTITQGIGKGVGRAIDRVLGTGGKSKPAAGADRGAGTGTGSGAGTGTGSGAGTGGDGSQR